MADTVVEQLIPRLKGLVDPRAEQEIVLAFKRLFNYYDAKIADLQSRTIKSSTQIQTIQQNPLFSGALATPLIDNTTGSNIGTAAQSTSLTPADIPNLPASKITSGTFNVARIPSLDVSKITTGVFGLAILPTNILKTNTGLVEDTTGAPNVNTGKTRIRDNAGNLVFVMTCA